MEIDCYHACGSAVGLWGTSKNPPTKSPYPMSTDKLQGPFQLPGGGTGYVLPLPSFAVSPAAGSTPTPSQGSSNKLGPLSPSPGSSTGAPGPFSSYPGADLNVSNCNNGDCQPPDVAADVSPTQNVEFINYLGLYVWAKPALPVASPAPTPQAITSLASFWCIGNGANNQPLPGCGNGIPLPGYNLGDTQVGYDSSLGRWLTTTLSFPSNQSNPNYVYLAVSNTGDAASGGWTKWGVQVCGGSSPIADQPLLGWSNTYVGIDVDCLGPPSRGPDNLIVIPNNNIVPPAMSLPAPINVGSSRVDLQACKLEYSIVSPK